MDSVTDSDDFTFSYPDSIEEAVLADLKRWGPDVARTGLAAMAVAAARDLDAGMAATPSTQMHAQLRETMLALAKMAADVVTPEEDEVDEVKRKRQERRERHGA